MHIFPLPSLPLSRLGSYVLDKGMSEFAYRFPSFVEGQAPEKPNGGSPTGGKLSRGGMGSRT